MISKRELNKSIDRAVRQLCVDTVSSPENTSYTKIKTCEKILRKQFGFDDKAIAKLRK